MVRNTSYAMVYASGRNTLNKAVSVENYTHGFLYGKIFLFFLFTEPLMQVHFVNLIKFFLIQNAFIPKFLQMCIEFLGIIITNELPDVVQLFIALDARKQPQQIKLSRIENCRLSFHN